MRNRGERQRYRMKELGVVMRLQRLSVTRTCWEAPHGTFFEGAMRKVLKIEIFAIPSRGRVQYFVTHCLNRPGGGAVS